MITSIHTTPPVLTGARCQCCACGLYFVSERAFDRHRQGNHGGYRYCLTATDLRAAGWARDARGFWSDMPPGHAREAKTGPRSPDPLPPHSPAPDGPLLHTFREAA